MRRRDTQIARKRGQSGKYIDVLGESGLSLKIRVLRPSSRAA